MKSSIPNRPAAVALFFCVAFFALPTCATHGAAATRPAAPPASAPAGGASETGGASDDLTGLSLEQLMQVPIETTNSLTRTERSLAPAAITTIDHDQIEQADPRSLTALLNVYVPNFESFPNEFEQTTIGERGIVGDRDNKFLVLVNGQDINERSHGFLPELDQQLTGDLHEVDVVRGPGSATYGPGAIAGVISMQTYNGLDFQGTDMTARAGILDESYSYEFRHGQQLSPDSGWFLYGGFAQLTGSNSINSPIIQDGNYANAGDPSGPDRPGEPLPFNYNNDLEEYDKQPQIKLHAEYDNGGLTAWARYTRGGESDSFLSNRGFYTSGDTGGFVLGADPNGVPGYTGVGYEQLTGFVGYKGELSDHLQLDSSVSYDVTNFQRVVFGFLNDDNQEQIATGRATLTWDPSPANSLAVGVEFRNYYLGLPSWMGLPTDVLNSASSMQNGLDSGFPATTAPHSWMSYLGSVLAEDQWHINKQLTLIASGRMDKDLYTQFLFSPRAALEYQANSKETLKAIFSQSDRTNDEEDMRAQREASGELSKAEVSTNYELRYERKQSDDLFLAASAYYNRLYAIDFGGAAETPLGFYKTAGIEAEATYRTQDNAFTFSHGYTKLVGQHLSTAEFDNVTAALNGINAATGIGYKGFGYDLSNWANNVTKLTAHHQFNRSFSVDGNIQVLWDFTGDYNVRQQLNNQNPTEASYGTGRSSAFDSSVFLNLGAQYDLDNHSTVRVDAYNILGWADQTLNKQMTETGAYRVAAPAFTISYKYSF